MLAGAISMAPIVPNPCGSVASVYRHFSLSRITRFVRGRRRVARMLINTTGKLPLLDVVMLALRDGGSRKEKFGKAKFFFSGSQGWISS